MLKLKYNILKKLVSIWLIQAFIITGGAYPAYSNTLRNPMMWARDDVKDSNPRYLLMTVAYAVQELLKKGSSIKDIKNILDKDFLNKLGDISITIKEDEITKTVYINYLDIYLEVTKEGIDESSKDAFTKANSLNMLLTKKEQKSIRDRLLKFHDEINKQLEAIRESSADPDMYVITIREEKRFSSEFVKSFSRNIKKMPKKSAIETAFKEASSVYLDMIPKPEPNQSIPEVILSQDIPITSFTPPPPVAISSVTALIKERLIRKDFKSGIETTRADFIDERKNTLQELLGTLKGHTGGIKSLQAFHDDNGLLTIVSGSGDRDRTIKIWKEDIRHNFNVRTLEGHNGTIWSLQVFHDDNGLLTIVSGSLDRTIKIWKEDNEHNFDVTTLEGLTNSIYSLRVFQDDKGLLTIISGSNDSTIKIWKEDNEHNFDVTTLGGYASVHSLQAFKDDNGLLTIVSESLDSGNNYTIKIWKEDNKHNFNVKTLKGHTSGISSLQVFQDKDNNDLLTIVSGSDDKTIKIWKEDIEHNFKVTTLEGHTDGVLSLRAFQDKDNKGLLTIVSGSGIGDKTIKIWKEDIEHNFNVTTLKGHTDSIFSLQAFQDNKGLLTIVSGGWDKTIKIWKEDMKKPDDISQEINDLAKIPSYYRDPYLKIQRALKTDIPVLFIKPIDSLDTFEEAFKIHMEENKNLIVRSITATPFTDKAQIIGSYMPVESKEPGSMQTLRFEKGVLYNLIEECKSNPDKLYVFKIDQIEAVPAKVRSQLNQFLLTGELEVSETGEKLLLPKNLRIMAVMTEGYALKDEAFYQRFLRKTVQPIDNVSFIEIIKDRFNLPRSVRGRIMEAEIAVPKPQLLILAAYIKGRIDDENKISPLTDDEQAKIAEEEIRLFTLSDDERYDHKLIFSVSKEELTIDGVALPISKTLLKKLTKEKDIFRVIKQETGLIITNDTLRALSAIARNIKYYNRVIRLEGPTGAGKTFIAQALSKMLDIPFYGEPVHSQTKQSRWLGIFKPDASGNYYLDSDTQFMKLLQNGGVTALSELNTAVKDDTAKLGWWLVPLAKGEKEIELNEYPRPPPIKTIRRSKDSIIIIDINPYETYQARGALPLALDAYTQAVWIGGRYTEEELKEISLSYLEGLPDKEKEFYANSLSKYHFKLQEELAKENRENSKDMPHIITLRQLKNASSMIINNNKDISEEENFISAIETYYALSFKTNEDQDLARDLISMPGGVKPKKYSKPELLPESNIPKTSFTPGPKITIPGVIDLIEDRLIKKDFKSGIKSTRADFTDERKDTLQELLGTLKGHTSGILSLQVFQDDNGLLTIVSGSRESTIKIWKEDNEHNFNVKTLKGHTSGISSLQVFQDDNGLLTIVSGSVDYTIKIWKEDNEHNFNVRTLEGHDGGILSLQAFQDDKGLLTIVSGGRSDDKTIKIWKEDNEHNFNVRTLEGHAGGILSLHVFQDDNGLLTIVSGSGDYTIKIWKEDKLHDFNVIILEVEGQNDSIASLKVFHDNNNLLTIISGSGQDDSTIKIWKEDIGHNFNVKTLEGHVSTVWSLEVFQDKDNNDLLTIVSGSFDRTIKIWKEDKLHNFNVKTLKGHTDGIYSLHAFQDNNGLLTIVSVSKDKTIKIWKEDKNIENHPSPEDCIKKALFQEKLPVFYSTPGSENSFNKLEAIIKNVFPDAHIEKIRSSVFLDDFTLFGGYVIDSEAESRGEKRFKWADGILPRLIKEAQKDPNRMFIISFENFQYMKPGLAVSLNAILQERTYYSPVEAEKISIPENMLFTATGSNEIDLSISQAEQNRWVRIYDTNEAIPEDPDLDIAAMSVEELNKARPVTNPTLRKDEGELLVPVKELLEIETKVVHAMNKNKMVILEGDPGGGKTDIGADIAERFGMEYFIYSAHARSSLEDFIGSYTQDENGRFILTSEPDKEGHFRIPFLEFFTHGGVFVIDEGAIGNRSQQLIAWLTGIARGEKDLSLNEHPGVEPSILKRNKDFHIIITTNNVDSTPGRETIPIEVLRASVRIEVSNKFQGASYKAILERMYSSFSTKGLTIPNKRDLNKYIKLQIKLHTLMQDFTMKHSIIENPERHLLTLRDIKNWTKALIKMAEDSGDWDTAFRKSFELIYLDQFDKSTKNNAIDILKKEIPDLGLSENTPTPTFKPREYSKPELLPESNIPKTSFTPGPKITIPGAIDLIEDRLIKKDFKSGIETTRADFTDERKDTLHELFGTLKGHTDSIRSLQAFQDDKGLLTIVSGSNDKTIKIWKEDIKHNFNVKTLEGHNNTVRSLQAFHDDKGLLTIISGGGDSTIKIWKEDVGHNFNVKTLEGNFNTFLSLQAFQDDKGLLTIVSGSNDSTIKIWREDNEHNFSVKTLEGHNNTVPSLQAFHDDKGLLTIISGGGDSTIKIWKEDNKHNFKVKILEDYGGGINSLRAFQDNNGLLTIISGSWDKTIKIWKEDNKHNFNVKTLEGHTDTIWSLQAFQDDKGLLTIISGSMDKTIKIWKEDIGHNFNVKTLEGHDSSIYSLQAFQDDNDLLTIVSGSMDDTIKIWKENDIKNIFQQGILSFSEKIEKNTGFQSENTVKSRIKDTLDLGFHGLLLLEPGSREKEILSDFSKTEGYKISSLESSPDMTSMDLIGGLFPVLKGELSNNGKEFSQKPGFLSRAMLKKDNNEKRLLVIHNIDAMPERVRVVLNNFLLKGYLELPDDSGKVSKFYLPENTKLIATLSTESQREFSSAFFNRFVKLNISPLTAYNEGYSETLQALVSIYGLTEEEARKVQGIYLMVKSLETGGEFWPSGKNYMFTVKEALLHGEFLKLAKEEALSKGIKLKPEDIDSLIATEAMRLYGGLIKEHEKDYRSFVNIILKSIFSHSLVKELSGEVTMEGAEIKELSGVPIINGQGNPINIEDMSFHYRLTLVSNIVRTISSVLRGFQADKMVSLKGPTAGSKTTIGVFLAHLMGLDYYIYSSHADSKSSDLTLGLARTPEGAYKLEVREFLKRVEKGNQILIIDEANIKPEILWILNGIARGEKEISVELPGEEPFTVNIGKNVFVLFTMNPEESYASREEIPQVLLENVFRLWAPCDYPKDELNAILSDFLISSKNKISQEGLIFLSAKSGLNDFLLKATIQDVLTAVEEKGKNSLREFNPSDLKKLEKELLKNPDVKKSMEEIRSAVRISSPEVKIIFSIFCWWSMSADGKVTTVPLYELANPNRSKESIVGLIIHEIRHKRYSLTHEEIIKAGESIKQESVIKEKAFHDFWNPLEDIRIDSIKDPALKGENDYIAAMNESLFGKKHLSKKDKKIILQSAKIAPHRAFTNEILAFAYTGKTSEVFNDLPGNIKKAVTKVIKGGDESLLSLACFTKNSSLDFESIKNSSKTIYEEKIRSATNSLRVLCNGIWPIYKDLLGQAKKTQPGKGGETQEGGGVKGEGIKGEGVEGEGQGGPPIFMEVTPEELMEILQNTPKDGLPPGTDAQQIILTIKGEIPQELLEQLGLQPSEENLDLPNLEGTPQAIPPGAKPNLMTPEESNALNEMLTSQIDAAKEERLEAMKQNEPFNLRMSEVSSYGKRLARGLIQVFRMPSEPEIEESSTGRIINPIRYLLRHQEPFDEEIEILGKPDIALGITFDTSGSMKGAGYLPALKKMLAIFMSCFNEIGAKKADYSISFITSQFDGIKGFKDKYSLNDLNQKQGEIEAWMDKGGRPGKDPGNGIHLFNAVTGIIEKYKNTDKKNKLEIVFTDGEDTGGDLKYDSFGKPIPSERLKEKLDHARKLGIEIVGIGFGTRDTEVFDKYIQLDKESSELVVEALLKIARRKALTGSLPSGNLASALSITLKRYTVVPELIKTISRNKVVNSSL